MKILIIFTFLISFLFINFKNVNSSEKNYFDEAVSFFKKKILKNPNLSLNKI